jgi:hypothetical protein
VDLIGLGVVAAALGLVAWFVWQLERDRRRGRMPGASGGALDPVIEVFQPGITVVRAQQEADRRAVRASPAPEDGLPPRWDGPIKITPPHNTAGRPLPATSHLPPA